jgi:hypothetical protein
VTGQVAGKTFSVHAEGDRMILTREGQAREEVDLASPPTAAGPVEAGAPPPSAVCPDGSPAAGVAEDSTAQEWPPGSSPLDEALRRLTALDPATPSAEAPSLEAPPREPTSSDADAAGGVS